MSTGSAPNYHQLLETLEHAEAMVTVDEGLLKDLRDRFETDRKRESLSQEDSQLEYAQALVKSHELLDIFTGVQLLSKLPPAQFTSAESRYAFGLGLFRLGENAEALVHVNSTLEVDKEHYRALVLKRLLTIRVEEQKVRKLLVYIDGGSSGLQALLTAVKIAKPSDVIVLLSIWEDAEAMIGVDAESNNLRSVEERQQEVVEKFQADFSLYCKKLNLNFSSIFGLGSPRDAILQQIERHAIDVLVIGQELNANIFFKLTSTTVTDQCVAHAPCQVIVAKDVIGARRNAIKTTSDLQKLNPLVDARPAPPRRAHTQESAPLATPAEAPLVDQMREGFNSMLSYFNAPAAASASAAPTEGGPPPEPAPLPPSSTPESNQGFRLSFDYIKQRLSSGGAEKQQSNEAEWNGD